jgi:hypothetical protein
MRRANVLPAVVLVTAAVALLVVCVVAFLRVRAARLAGPPPSDVQTEATAEPNDPPPPTGPAEPPAPSAPEWTEAPGGVVRIGDIEVKVVAVVLFGEGRFLGIRLRVANRSQSRTIAFGNWDKVHIRLTDDLGNKYDRRVRNSGKETLRPGDVTQTALDFRPPAPQATALFLQLPASHVGERGAFRFRIPTSVIEVEAPTPEPPGPGRTGLPKTNPPVGIPPKVKGRP